MFDIFNLSIFRRTPPTRGLIIGEGNSGKTSLLYNLLDGSTDILTIPTIGFNVEECRVKDGSHWKFPIWDLGGGCGKLSPLFRQFYRPNDFLIFLHDISQGEDFADYSLDTFPQVLRDFDDKAGKYVWVVFNKQDCIADAAERAARVARWSQKFRAAVPRNTRMHVRVADLPGFSARYGVQTDALLRLVRAVLQSDPEWGRRTDAVRAAGAAKTLEAEPSAVELQAQADAAALLAENGSAEAFWREFEDGSIPEWDHAAHLRAGFMLVVRAGFVLTPEALTDVFIEKLERLKAARPELFRNTVHVTMSWFWISHIYELLTAYAAAHGSPLGCNDFPVFMRANAPLMNRSLWRQFYSKETMFSQPAKDAIIPPDLRALPRTSRSPVPGGVLATQSRDQALDLSRYAFAVVRKTLLGEHEREVVFTLAVRAFRAHTMRQRSLDAAYPVFSATQTSFWIHVIAKTLLELDVGETTLLRQAVTYNGPLRNMSFARFQATFNLTGDEWRQFYSEAAWHDEAARKAERVPPAVQQVGELQRKKPRDLIIKDGGSMSSGVLAHTATNAELAFYAALVIWEAEGQDETEDETDWECISKAEVEKREKQAPSTKGELLSFIFDSLATLDSQSLKERKAETADRVVNVFGANGTVKGLTQANFWVSQVADHLLQDIEAHKAEQKTSFAAFIHAHPLLAWDDLPWLSYSPQLWNSRDGHDKILEPDRRPGQFLL